MFYRFLTMNKVVYYLHYGYKLQLGQPN